MAVAMEPGHGDRPQADGASSESSMGRGCRSQRPQVGVRTGRGPVPTSRGGSGDRLTIARLRGGHTRCTPAVSLISCIPSQQPHGLCCDLGLGLPGRPDSRAGRGWLATHLWMRLVLPT